MADPRIDLRGMIETQIKRLDSVLDVKVEGVINQPKPDPKKAPAAPTVDEICKLADTMGRLIAQANTM